MRTLLKMGHYYSTTVLLLGHVSKIVSILLSKLSDCPNTDTLLCYYNYPFLTVYGAIESDQSDNLQTCSKSGIRNQSEKIVTYVAVG